LRKRLFGFLELILEIRDFCLKTFPSQVKADEKGCGCRKNEKESFKKVSHGYLPL
jgi:hypothetical protein